MGIGATLSIDPCHATVRHWWNRSGPLFAVEIAASG
jgi:hypothetical protein